MTLPTEKLETLPHILIVDDDERIRALLSRYLHESGFLTATASDAGEARAILERFQFDALVVDVMMPGENGRDFTRFVRDRLGAPVLLLTALGEVDDRISGFEAGADDYLPKPFEPRELVMRLQAILRRAPRQTAEVPQDIIIGTWRYDPSVNMLEREGERVRLTTVEGNLLRALARRAGQPISREELARLCDMGDSGERTIDVQVTRLRRKIEEDSRIPRYLQTVRGKGYLLRTGD